jgi:hypothetical protein
MVTTRQILLCIRLRHNMIRRKKIEVTRPSGRTGVPLVNPVGDHMSVGGVRLNAGRTQQYLEFGE